MKFTAYFADVELGHQKRIAPRGVCTLTTGATSCEACPAIRDPISFPNGIDMARNAPARPDPIARTAKGPGFFLTNSFHPIE
jgi:hypothetical protein